MEFLCHLKCTEGLKYFLFVPEQFYVINTDKG